MRLSDILKVDCIKVPLLADEKQQAIFELIDLVASANHIQNVDTLKQAVWKREQTRTTGIGHGLAVPHGKTDVCDRLVMAIGISQHPLEFGSIDKKPVHMIVLLAGPTNMPGPHVQAMAQVSRLMTNPQARESLFSATTAHQVYDLIINLENSLITR